VFACINKCQRHIQCVCACLSAIAWYTYLPTHCLQHARLLGQYQTLGHKAGRLSLLFRTQQRTHAAAAAAAASALASATSDHATTQSALTRALAEIDGLRANLAAAVDARKTAESLLAAYTGGASGASRALLAQRRMTMARGGIVSVAAAAVALTRDAASAPRGGGGGGAHMHAASAIPHPSTALNASVSPLSPSSAPVSAATEAAVHTGSTAMSTLLAASVARPPVTCAAADGVVVTQRAVAGGASSSTSATNGGDGVVLYDPLFPQLQLTLGHDGDALAVASGRRGLHELQVRNFIPPPHFTKA
jgi:hypothetical protein